MNAGPHSGPTLGILLVTLGMVAILAIPYVLRSSLNRTIGIPSTEQRFRLTWRASARIVLLVFWAASGALSLGRVYTVPIIWVAASLAAFALLSISERRWGKRE